MREVPKQQGIQRIDNRYSSIVKDISDIDVESIYQSLKKNIKLGDNRLNVDAMVKAVDDNAELYYNARRLLLNAIKIQKMFKLERNGAESKLFERARVALNGSKGRTTKQDLEDYVHVHFMDELKELEERETDLDGIVKTLTALEEIYKHKIFALDLQSKLKNDRSKVI